MTIDLDTFAILRGRCEHSAAERDNAMRMLALLLAFVDGIGGYTTHDQQVVIRDARALLAESGVVL